MPELRWTLLIIGALFVGALAWWEIRRQRQSPNQGIKQGPNSNAGAAPHTGAHTASGRDAEHTHTIGDGLADARGHREPTISFPELQPAPATELRAPVRDREPTHDPPVVELDEESFAELNVDEEIAGEISGAGSMRGAGRNATQERGLDEAIDPDPPSFSATDEGGDDEDAVTVQMDATAESPAAPVGFMRHEALDEREHAQPAAAQASRPASAAVGATAAGPPVVEWPGEEARKIVALRLVSAPAARFSGRTVRLALAAEGFVLGKFDIFHKPGPDSRAMLSAASLTKPGTFTLNTMDAQRYGGLSLFAVLPGPLPPQRTFDELLTSARSLNDRLQGALQDERGEPLTPVRSATIRDSLGTGPPAKPDGGGRGAAAHAGNDTHRAESPQ